jgi:formylglycine-generating enzyme required for sulfatase activity
VWYAWPRPKVPLPPTLQAEGGDMVLVPAGRFPYGKDKTPTLVPDFYIDKTEVTNAAYQQFCKKTGHALPPKFESGSDTDPVVNVTFSDAQDFARSVNKRLPTSEEWEKAVRGTSGYLFAWGDDLDATKANVKNNPNVADHVALPVGSFNKCVSQYGALDMTGNVWEWLDARTAPNKDRIDQFKDLLSPPAGANEDWYSFRGGSFNVPLKNAVADEFIAAPARFHAVDLGFRCVKSVPR